jgi:hypothetical protein
LANETDRDHAAAVSAFDSDRGPYLLPAGILAEATYMLEARIGEAAVAAFLEDLGARRFLLHCGENDFERIGELVERYRDLPLGFADASVVACAEKRGRHILSVDRRDFDVVAGDVGLEILP